MQNVKNVVYKSAIYAEGDIHIGDKYVINGQPREIPLQLTHLPFVDKKEVIGRDGDVQEVRKLINDSPKVVLVNGLGGIGKTTLAKYFVAHFREKYNYMAWVNVTSGIKEALINDVALVDSLCLREELEVLPKDDSWVNHAFSLVANRMRQLGGEHSTKKNLLIVDNAGEDIEHTQTLDQIAMRPNWKVLVTSREKLIGFAEYELGLLSEEDARQLFYHHYQREENDAVVEEILDLIDYHTLLIEVISKTGQSLRLNLEDILSRLKKKGLNISEKDKAIKFPHHYNQKVFDVFEYLLEMFKIAGLNEYEQWLMMQFAVLPSKYIPYEKNSGENILEFLQIEQGVKKDEFTRAVNSLVEKGWMQWDGENDCFKMHALIQEILRFKLAPDPAKCAVLIATFIKKHYVPKNQNPIKQTKYLAYAESILKAIPERKNSLIILAYFYSERLMDIGKYQAALENAQNNLAACSANYPKDTFSLSAICSIIYRLYFKLGNYKKSLELIAKAESFEGIKKSDTFEHLDWKSSIGEKTTPDFEGEQLRKRIKYNDRGLISLSSGNLTEALNLLQEALNLQETGDAIDYLDLALTHSNLGIVLGGLGRWREAIKHEKSALDIREKWLPLNHPRLAESYNNLGESFRVIKKFDKALEFHQKALSIRETLFYSNPHHPDLAQSYQNIANIFCDLEQFDKAEEYVSKVKDILEKVTSVNNHVTGRIYHDISHIYLQMEDLAQAKKYIGLSLEILQKELPAGHPDLQQALEGKGVIESAMMGFKPVSIHKVINREIITEADFDYLSFLINEPKPDVTNDKEIASLTDQLKQNEDKKLYLARAIAKARVKDLKGAVGDCTNAIRLDSNYANAYFHRGLFRVPVEISKQEAMKDLDKAIEISPDVWFYYLVRGRLKAIRRDFEAALTDFDKAIDLNPDFEESFPSRAEAKIQLGLFSEAETKRKLFLDAINDINKFFDLNPGGIDEFFARGNAHLQLGNYQKAIQDFKKCLALNPQHENAYYKLGKAYFETDKFKDAEEAFSQVIKLNPTAGDAYHGRGISRSKSGERNSACLDLKKAVNLGYLPAKEAYSFICQKNSL